MPLVPSLSPADERAWRPPQFGLRGLFVLITLLCGGFALAIKLGMALTAMLLLFGSLITVHILGNVLGTRLRDGDHADPERFGNESFSKSGLTPISAPLELNTEPAKELQQNSRLHLPWIIAAAVGAMLGGFVGGNVLLISVGPKLTLAGLCVGIFSSAALGGLAGFMMMSFWSVLRDALREASKNLPTDPPASRL